MPAPPTLPDCRTPSELAAYLSVLRAWSGMSLRAITSGVNRLRRGGPLPATARSTVAYCFDPGRVRLDRDLVIDVARVLGLPEPDLSRLREVCLVATATRPIASLADVTAGLPPLSGTFTGRDGLIASALHAVQVAPAGGRVITLHGPAGIGKTELSLGVARRLTDHGYGRDLRFFADLHGFDAQREPTPPEAVLDRLLKLLGLRDSTVWAILDPARKIARVRDELRGRDALIVLDSAADERQVRPLLDALADCAVVVTSRHRLPLGTPIEVGPMEYHECLGLLSAHDTEDRLRREPGIAVRLINDLCGRSPLDLVALGGQLADPGQAAWTLTDHAERLAAFPRDEISRPALVGSTSRLDPHDRRVFRLLALYPGNDFSRYDIAVLAGLDPETAEDALRKLFDLHLLLRRETHRYRTHDVVEAYARRLLHAEEPLSEQQRALERLRTAPTLKRHRDGER